MEVFVYVAVLAGAVLSVPVVKRFLHDLPDRLGPVAALWVQLTTMSLLSAASTVALALLVLDAASRVPAVAALDSWSVPILSTARPWAPIVGAIAAAVLVVITWRVVSVARSTAGGYRLARAATVLGDRDRHAARSGAAVVIDDARPYAWAAPGLGRRRGAVVISTAMRDALDGPQHAALLAHERAHLDGHHHLILGLAALAAAANPTMTSMRDAVTYAVERRADDAAARTVGDPRVVAQAIGRAARATRDARVAPFTASGIAGVTAGPVPRRVAALIRPPAPASTTGRAARRVLAAALLTCALAAGTAAVLAAVQMHNAIELAEQEPPHCPLSLLCT